jgi:hypothetical protein
MEMPSSFTISEKAEIRVGNNILGLMFLFDSRQLKVASFYSLLDFGGFHPMLSQVSATTAKLVSWLKASKNASR